MQRALRRNLKFENRRFTLKAHEMFSVHNASKKFENAAVTGHDHFGFAVEKYSNMKEIT